MNFTGMRSLHSSRRSRLRLLPSKSTKNLGILRWLILIKNPPWIGAVQGIPVCFDAKECAFDTFALENIHEHQVSFMNSFERQEGIAFFLIYFTAHEQFYYLRIQDLMRFWERASSGGRKSFRIDELDPQWFFLMKEQNSTIPYLEMIQLDLQTRT